MTSWPRGQMCNTPEGQRPSRLSQTPEGFICVLGLPVALATCQDGGVLRGLGGSLLTSARPWCSARCTWWRPCS